MVGTTAVLIQSMPAAGVDLEHEILSMPAPLPGRFVVMAENGIAGRAVERALAVLSPGTATTTDAQFAELEPALAASRRRGRRAAVPARGSPGRCRRRPRSEMRGGLPRHDAGRPSGPTCCAPRSRVSPATSGGCPPRSTSCAAPRPPRWCSPVAPPAAPAWRRCSPTCWAWRCWCRTDPRSPQRARSARWRCARITGTDPTRRRAPGRATVRTRPRRGRGARPTPADLRGRLLGERSRSVRLWGHERLPVLRAVRGQPRPCPSTGRDRKQVLDELRQIATEEDASWETGQISGSYYCGDHEHYDYVSEAFGLFGHVNALQRDVCPSGTKFEGEIIAMTLDMLHADAVTDVHPGRHRDQRRHRIDHPRDARLPRGRPVTQRGITHPNVVKPETAHPAFDKACHLFGIELRVAPIDPVTATVVVDEMARADRREHDRHHRIGLQLRLRHGRPDRGAVRPGAGARRRACTSTAAWAASSCRGARSSATTSRCSTSGCPA